MFFPRDGLEPSSGRSPPEGRGSVHSWELGRRKTARASWVAYMATALLLTFS